MLSSTCACNQRLKQWAVYSNVREHGNIWINSFKSQVLCDKTNIWGCELGLKNIGAALLGSLNGVPCGYLYQWGYVFSVCCHYAKKTTGQVLMKLVQGAAQAKKEPVQFCWSDRANTQMSFTFVNTASVVTTIGLWGGRSSLGALLLRNLHLLQTNFQRLEAMTEQKVRNIKRKTTTWF